MKLAKISILLIICFPLTMSAATCAKLTRTLSFGSTNSNAGGEVTPLQTFLKAKGYLASPPTGRFGSQTAAAVKKFQSKSGLSAIGVVGSATRVAIAKASCPTIPALDAARQAPAIILAATPIPTPTLAPTPTPVANLVTLPTVGSELTIGQNYQIEWTPDQSGSILDVVLEDEHGAGAGYIASSLGGVNHYDWKVGNASIADNKIVIAPGLYRLRVVDTATYGEKVSERSGLFTVEEAPLSVSNLLPTSAPADGKTSIVLYGNGFSDLTKIHLNGMTSLNIDPAYRSPDNKMMLFTVPLYLSLGFYDVSVYNDYSTSYVIATGTPSNSVTLEVRSVP